MRYDGDGSLGLLELFETVDGDVEGSLVPLVVGYHLASNTNDTQIQLISPESSSQPSPHQPTHASNSSSLKHLMLSFSTKISNPLSINVLAVFGVNADRRSCSFFSHRSQRAWCGLVDDDGPAVDGRGAGAAEVDSDIVGKVQFAFDVETL